MHTKNMPHGLRGFRRFWIPPEYITQGEWVPCQCGWRPDLGSHYRIRDGSDTLLSDEGLAFIRKQVDASDEDFIKPEHFENGFEEYRKAYQLNEYD